MTEHCDLSLFISCCVETMCLCCTLCENINKISKCVNNNEENNFTIPESRNAPAYIVEQPYFPQQYLLQPQFSPQQVGEQPSPNVSNSELNLSPSAPCLGSNYAANQSTVSGITSSNYLAPPPSYSEAMGMETQTQAQSSNSLPISKT